MNKKKKSDSRNTTQFSIASLLAGSLSALFGIEFAIYLAADETQKKSTKMAMLADRFTPVQKRMSDLVRTGDIQLKQGQYDGVRKTCHTISSLLKEFYRKTVSPEYVYPLVARVFYRLMVNIGDCLFQKGDSKAALNFYMDVLAYYPEDQHLLKKIARMNYTLGYGALPEAEKYYRMAQQVDPEDLEVYENIGRILAVQPERKEDALFLYREAMNYCKTDLDRIRFYLHMRALDAEDADIPLRIGRLYQRMGMFSEARRYMETARSLNPDGWAALDLAYLSIILNDLPRAEELLYGNNFEEDGEQFYAQYYFLGLLKEEEDFVEEARYYLRKVPENSPYYWKALVIRARLALQEGDLSKATNLVTKIPDKKRSNLGWEYLELSESLAANWKGQSPGQSEYWQEQLKNQEPNYFLWKDIRKRSMGPGFWRKYEAMEVLGSGPSGQVWLSRDRYLGHNVVIKQLSSLFLKDPATLRRIQGQLRSWRDLNSPRIVHVYEECYYNGNFFYSMEYLKGHTLQDYIRRWAPLPITGAAGMMLQLCYALNDLYRQKRDISHGNLKTENIFLTPGSYLKITDFDYLWAVEGTKVFNSKFLKQHPGFLRSFLYAAPERFDVKGMLNGLWGKLQSGGDNIEMVMHGVDHRADLFSLGVIFFELVTGFLPFREPTLKALLSFHRSRSLPSLRELNPTIPFELEDIILRLMARDPYHRFSSPLEVAEAIKKVKVS